MTYPDTKIYKAAKKSMYVDVASQTLQRSGVAYPVSTAAKGLGETFGSFQTPRGRFRIACKIGQGLPLKSVFIGRRWTGEIYHQDLGQRFPQRDWILSRILWLDGCEAGKNKLGNCDTMKRYIYIHGTADEHLLGEPHSHGCIRMANQDVIVLFDQVQVGDELIIG